MCCCLSLSIIGFTAEYFYSFGICALTCPLTLMWQTAALLLCAGMVGHCCHAFVWPQPTMYRTNAARYYSPITAERLRLGFRSEFCAMLRMANDDAGEVGGGDIVHVVRFIPCRSCPLDAKHADE